jgi:hypothetical protein
MNRWTLFLILIALGAVGMLNRDKISAYLKQGPTEVVSTDNPVVTDVNATPNPAKDSIEQARKVFPQLGVPNSVFNNRFVQLYNATKTSDPALLVQADWPMQLAERTAHDLNVAAVTPTPPPTELSVSALNARPPGLVGATVAPAIRLPGLKGSSLDQRPPAHNK